MKLTVLLHLQIPELRTHVDRRRASPSVLLRRTRARPLPDAGGDDEYVCTSHEGSGGDE
jgi:hypothetical protein